MIESSVDVDAPLTEEEFERGIAAMRARKARANTGLTQRKFASLYGIPLATLKDWEQARRLPDTTAQAYLRAITKEPDLVAKAVSGEKAA